MILILQCARLLFKEMRGKADECCYHFLHIHGFAVRTMWEVRLMIEADLLVIIYLLYYGMISSTILNMALIITTTVVLIKQK